MEKKRSKQLRIRLPIPSRFRNLKVLRDLKAKDPAKAGSNDGKAGPEPFDCYLSRGVRLTHTSSRTPGQSSGLTLLSLGLQFNWVVLSLLLEHSILLALSYMLR